MSTKQSSYSADESTKIPLGNGRTSSYIPKPGLKEAVNLALIVRNRPLLLMGEPGTGKTMLAKAVACEWYGDKWRDHYFEWTIKSTSKAQDGLFVYDALRRLADAQALAHVGKDADAVQKLSNTKLGAEGSYYRHGILADAVRNSVEGRRSILLIDEIDKADIDFPNDLLHELDNYEFTVPETGDRFIKPENFVPPLVIVTSNREKELPSAFLRRCIYCWIDFPDDAEMEKILGHHFPTAKADDIRNTAKMFLKLRDLVSSRLSASDKKIGTSEIVDWFSVVDLLNSEKNKLGTAEKDLFDQAEQWMAKLKGVTDDKSLNEIVGGLPFYQVLFKNIETVRAFINR